jgi:hypothetical protein
MPAPPPRPAKSTPIDSITSREIGFVRSLSSDPSEAPASTPPANSDDPGASSTVG